MDREIETTVCSIRDIHFDVEYVFYPNTEFEEETADIRGVKIGGVEIYKHIDVFDQILSDICLDELQNQIVKQKIKD